MDAHDSIRSAFAYCEAMARAHYENFPVASLLLPKRQRPFVAAVYAFARTADDYADEGNRPAQERLDLLEDWGRRLEAASRGEAQDPVFVALAETMLRTNLPLAPLSDLLTAFRMDVMTNRFATFNDLLHYCRHSANPVGRIVLHLFGRTTPGTILLSDQICTGLQLTNFWQDFSVDWQKGRLYIPLEDLRQFGYTEKEIAEKVINDRFRALMRFEVDRAKSHLLAGMSLPGLVGGRLGLELALTLRGGMGILHQVETDGYDVLRHRPAFRAMDKVRLVIDAILRRPL
jgi:squalene synthase HpnC